MFNIKLLALLLMVPLFAFHQSHAHAGEYEFDAKHTEVRASWDHLGISRQSATFSDVAGTLKFDPQRLEDSEVNVVIKIASVATGVSELDRALNSTPDYFNSEAYPTITFKSTKIIVTTVKSANLTGFLTINGITKPAVLGVVWNFDGEHPLAKINPVFQGVQVLGFSARTEIIRSDWGITRALPLVSDEIRISIEAELHKKN